MSCDSIVLINNCLGLLFGTQERPGFLFSTDKKQGTQRGF